MDHLAKKSLKIAKAVYNAATHPDQYQTPTQGSFQPQYHPNQQPSYGFPQPGQQQQYPVYNAQNHSQFSPSLPGQPAPPAPYSNHAYHAAPPAQSPPAASPMPPPPPYTPSPVNSHQAQYNPQPQPSSQWQGSMPPPTPISPASWPATPATSAPSAIPAVPPPLPHRPATSQFYSPAQPPHHPQVSPPHSDSPFGPPQSSAGQETGYIPAQGVSYGPPPVTHSQSFPASPMTAPPYQYAQPFPIAQNDTSIKHSNSISHTAHELPMQAPQQLTHSQSFSYGSQQQRPPFHAAQRPPSPVTSSSHPAQTIQETNSFIAELPADAPAHTSSSMPIELPAELPADPIGVSGKQGSKESPSHSATQPFKPYHPPQTAEAKEPSPSQSAAQPFKPYHPPNSPQQDAGIASVNGRDRQTSAPPPLNYSSHPNTMSPPPGSPLQAGAYGASVSHPTSPPPIHAVSTGISVHTLDQPKPMISGSSLEHGPASTAPASPPTVQPHPTGSQHQALPRPPTASPPPPNTTPVHPLPMPTYSPPAANPMDGYAPSNSHVGGLAASMQRMNFNNPSNHPPGPPPHWQQAPYQNGQADSKEPFSPHQAHPANSQSSYPPPSPYPQAHGQPNGYFPQG